MRSARHICMHPKRSIALVAVLVLSTAMTIGTAPVIADIAVVGATDAVVLNVQDAKLGEVLEKIATTYKAKVTSNVDLDTSVSGSYRGKLEGVIAALLSNYNFVMNQTPQGLNVMILQASVQATTAGAQATAVAPPIVPAAIKPAPMPLPHALARPTSASAVGQHSELSPEGRQLARELFGSEAPVPVVDEAFLKAYAKRAIRSNAMQRRMAPSAGPMQP